MKNLSDRMKALCVQACINCYEDEHGRGVHGEVNWRNYRNDTIEPFSIENCQGYTGVMDDYEHGPILVIAFRGSDEDADWKSNFDFKKIRKTIDSGRAHVVPYGNKDSGIRMHKGFVELYAKVRSMVRVKAAEAAARGIKVLVTGHSLGGALTTVCYIDLHHMFFTELHRECDLTGYAAAAPAVGNWEFKVSFDKRANGNFYNEQYGDDPVTMLPPWWMGYFRPNIIKRYGDIWANLTAPLFAIVPLAVWYHDPRLLIAAVKGEPIPFPKADSRK